MFFFCATKECDQSRRNSSHNAASARFLRRWLLHLVTDEQGSQTIEFAISLGTLMTFVFALMELCLVFYSYGMISESAREGTRYAVVHGSTCTTYAGASCTVTAAQIQTYVSGLGFPNPGGGTLTPVATFSPNTPGSTATVQVTYSFPIRMPLLPTRAISLSTQSAMTIVQ